MPLGADQKNGHRDRQWIRAWNIRRCDVDTQAFIASLAPTRRSSGLATENLVASFRSVAVEPIVAIGIIGLLVDEADLIAIARRAGDAVLHELSGTGAHAEGSALVAVDVAVVAADRQFDVGTEASIAPVALAEIARRAVEIVSTPPSTASDRRRARLAIQGLLARGVKVFYDAFEDVWGEDLYFHLDEVYRKRARFCVIFGSREYAAKAWPSRERQSAQARALEEKQPYILPARFDDTEIPGVLSTTAYLDLHRLDPA